MAVRHDHLQRRCERGCSLFSCPFLATQTLGTTRLLPVPMSFCLCVLFDHLLLSVLHPA